MPQKGTVIGDVIGSFQDEGIKVIKETGKQLVSSINILESLDPVNPAEVKQKSQEYKAKDEAKLAAARKRLHQEVIHMSPPPPEQPKPQQGAEAAEQGQVNQNAQMNNLQGQSSKMYVPPKKKMQPLVVQQKMKDKLQGAG